MRGVLGAVIVFWLLIGVIAAFQRGYMTHSDTSCATAGTIGLTVVAGPLNYFGVNPKVTECQLPQPSSMPVINR